jgi:hypothetical protein
MELKENQIELSNFILEIPKGIYNFSGIKKKIPKTIINKYSDNEIRWVLSYLVRQKSIRRIKRGMYSFNLTNNEFQEEFAKHNKKYPIEKLINIGKAYQSFESIVYDYHMTEGIQSRKTYLVSDEFKNIVLFDKKEIIIKYKKFRFAEISLNIFDDYFKKIHDSSYTYFVILFDVIEKYDLDKIILKRKLKIKSKSRLIDKIYKFKTEYYGKTN